MLKRRRTEQDELLRERGFPRAPKLKPRGGGPAGPPPRKEEPVPPLRVEEVAQEERAHAADPDEPVELPAAQRVGSPTRRRSEDSKAPLPEPSPAARARRKRRRGSFLRQLGVLAGILVLPYLVLPAFVSAGRIRPMVEERLSKELGHRVTVGSLRLSFGFGTLTASDVSIADDPIFSSSPFLHANRVDLSVERAPLIFSRRIEITGVSVDETTITLRHSAGQWNFWALLAAGPTGPATALGPPVRIKHGILVVRGGGDREEPFVLRDLTLDAPHFSTAADNPFVLKAAVEGGGTLKLNGRAGPVRWQGRTPSIPVSILINAKKVAMSEANLVTTLAPAVSGLLSLDSTIESDGNNLQLKGNGEFAKLRLSQHGAPADEPVAFGFDLEHDLAAGAGKLARFDVTVRKGGAGITGTYALTDFGAKVKFNVSAQGVPITPLSGLISAAGLPLPPGTSLQGGVAFVELEVNGSLTAPTTTGTVGLANTKLMSFDLEERLSSVSGLDLLHISRDLSITEWRSKVKVSPEGIQLTELEVALPEVGTFTGSGSIDANQTLDFQMNAVRNGVNEKRVIPFQVRGACVSPVFRQSGKTS